MLAADTRCGIDTILLLRVSATYLLAARTINSSIDSIKRALVRLMVSFITLYVIQAFPLWKNGLLILFFGKIT
jgi:hypothetical protein